MGDVSDRELRELEREWQRTPTREAVRAYVVARQRTEPHEPLPRKERFQVVFTAERALEEHDSWTKAIEEGPRTTPRLFHLADTEIVEVDFSGAVVAVARHLQVDVGRVERELSPL